MVFLNSELTVLRSCDKKCIDLGFGDVDVQDIVYYKKQLHLVMSNGRILSVDPKSLELDEEEQEWIEVKDLEGKALFLFDGGSFFFFFLAKDFLGIKPNCVCMGETGFFGVTYDFPGMYTSVFDFSDSSNKWLVSFPESSEIFWPSLVWLFPELADSQVFVASVCSALGAFASFYVDFFHDASTD
ncbi:F-box protein At2g17036-like isoform X2 [Mangifera indica]|uniref:F-box protein At2g17036-like isoform X2 n=1 Tax=Mangifera indica TaxID=29780 RepID=UPI001CFBEF7E|nr:F-box protein At2g17036-like isoform X2 [Mangifera indica]